MFCVSLDPTVLINSALLKDSAKISMGHKAIISHCAKYFAQCEIMAAVGGEIKHIYHVIWRALTGGQCKNYYMHAA